MLDVTADENDASTLYAVVHHNELSAVPAPVSAPVATGTSVYTSRDGGQTFAEITPTGAINPKTIGRAFSFAIDFWRCVRTVSGEM